MSRSESAGFDGAALDHRDESLAIFEQRDVGDNVAVDDEHVGQLAWFQRAELIAAAHNFRAGFRNQRWIAEAVLNIWSTLGGFDITRNNMPFPSNNMDATTAGVNIKYVLPPMPQLSIVAGGMYTVAGRNVGQGTTVYGSIFYVFDFSKKTKSSDQGTKTN